MKQATFSKPPFGPPPEKPIVWIEGEFVVSASSPLLVAKGAGQTAKAKSKRSATVLGLRHGLGELIVRLLAVATGCALTVALVLLWAAQLF